MQISEIVQRHPHNLFLWKPPHPHLLLLSPSLTNSNVKVCTYTLRHRALYETSKIWKAKHTLMSLNLVSGAFDNTDDGDVSRSFDENQFFIADFDIPCCLIGRTRVKLFNDLGLLSCFRNISQDENEVRNSWRLHSTTRIQATLAQDRWQRQRQRQAYRQRGNDKDSNRDWIAEA